MVYFDFFLINVSFERKPRNTTPTIAINPEDKLAKPSEYTYATTPINTGPDSPPASDISLHIPKKLAGFFFGDKSAPRVITKPLDIPLPKPANNADNN